MTCAVARQRSSKADMSALGFSKGKSGGRNQINDRSFASISKLTFGFSGFVPAGNFCRYNIQPVKPSLTVLTVLPVKYDFMTF